MKLQKILRSNLGFSMVEITVAMGLLGLATVAVMNLSESVTTNTRRAETMLSKSQFASALGSYLNSSLACEEMKSMTGMNTMKPMVLTKWKVAGMDEDILKDIRAGKKFKNFTLKTLSGSLATPGPGDPPFPVVSMNVGGSVSNYTKTFMNVVAEIEVNMKAGDPTVKRDYQYFFSIPVLAQGGQVRFCGEQKNMYETCAVMKGTYNESTKKCELEGTCSLKGSYTRCIAGTCPGYSSTPNPLNSNYSCPSGSTQIQTGSKEWSHVQPCSGKKCKPTTVHNSFAYFSCLYCPGM